MADPKRVARALQYQQDKPAWWDAVPVADAPGTVRTPTPQEMSWLDRLNELSAGAGKGIESQLEGYKNMVLHPVDTAQQMYQSGKAVVQDPSLLVKGLQAMGERAMGSPQGFGEVVGENINPRNLLRNLARPSIEELTVYHGTPHRFPATERNPLGEFDASKIGTGEGAQAYGHGIYVAESPAVAESYKKMSPQILPVGKYAPEEESAYYAARVVRQMGSPEKAIEKLAGTGKSQEFAQAIKDGSYKKFYDQLPQASLYHVDLPDEMIDKMLDWDKPLSEQPKAVQEAIEKLKPRMSTSWQKAINNKTSGQSLYTAIGSATNKQADSSALLAGVGIPGIRYLDAGSRGAEKGTRNFVIFPGEERNLKILERK